jgi:hypothetical protein
VPSVTVEAGVPASEGEVDVVGFTSSGEAALAMVGWVLEVGRLLI